MKARFPHAVALGIAEELVAGLAPFCERIVIAGSLRRGKPEVGDAEILFVPRFEARMASGDMFASESVNLADEQLGRWLADGTLSRRPSETGVFSWGKLNKLARHRSGLGVDFFTEPSPADWWRSLVIRTGPKELNIRLIESAALRGLRVHAYSQGITDARGVAVLCGSEREFFSLCGMPWLEPGERF